MLISHHMVSIYWLSLLCKHYTFVYRTVFVSKIMECLWRTVVIIKPNVLQTKFLQINSNRVDSNPCMVWISFGVYLLVEFGVFKDIPFHAWSHCIYIQNTYKQDTNGMSLTIEFDPKIKPKWYLNCTGIGNNTTAVDYDYQMHVCRSIWCHYSACFALCLNQKHTQTTHKIMQHDGALMPKPFIQYKSIIISSQG